MRKQIIPNCYFFRHKEDFNKIICYHEATEEQEWKDTYLIFYGFDRKPEIVTGEKYENRAEIVKYQMSRFPFEPNKDFQFVEVSIDTLTDDQYNFFIEKLLSHGDDEVKQ